MTFANHSAFPCAIHVCDLYAAERANGDQETEKGARTSNHVSDVAPGPPFLEGATATVGSLHRRSARSQQYTSLCVPVPQLPSVPTHFHRPKNGSRVVRPVPTASPGRKTPS